MTCLIVNSVILHKNRYLPKKIMTSQVVEEKGPIKTIDRDGILTIKHPTREKM